MTVYTRINGIPKNKICIVRPDYQITYSEFLCNVNKVAGVIFSDTSSNEIVLLNFNDKLLNLYFIFACLQLGVAYINYADKSKDWEQKIVKECNIQNKYTDDKNLLDSKYTIITLEEIEVLNPYLSYTEDNSKVAYIIYTSGSTGDPKAIQIVQDSILALCVKQTITKLTKKSRFRLSSSLSFDASVFEIFMALLNGCSLYIPRKSILSPEILEFEISKYKITHLWLTSCLFNVLVNTKKTIFSNLKELWVGGDVVNKKNVLLAKKHANKLIIVNGYGPSECTVFTTFYKIKKVRYILKYDTLPIGKAVDNTDLLVVDKKDQPIYNKEVLGELLVSGRKIMKGYLNGEKFHSFVYLNGLKYYRTGDIVSWVDSKNLNFHGRISAIQKIRGFRVNPIVIKNEIISIEGIKDAVVTCKKTQVNEQIVADIYIDSKFNQKYFQRELSKKLPRYLLPDQIRKHDKIYFNLNGKIENNDE